MFMTILVKKLKYVPRFLKTPELTSLNEVPILNQYKVKNVSRDGIANIKIAGFKLFMITEWIL